LPIIIEDDGTVKVVREVIETSTSLDEFLKKYRQNIPFQMPFLPNKCHSFSTSQNVQTFIIELPMGKRNFQVENMRYEIFMPWTYYGISIAENIIYKVQVCHSLKKVMKMSDKIFTMAFPNISSGDMCTGEMTGDFKITNKQPMHMAVNDFVDKILTGAYNGDYLDQVYSGKGIKEFQKGAKGQTVHGIHTHYFGNWEKLSKAKNDKQMLAYFDELSTESRHTYKGYFNTISSE